MRDVVEIIRGNSSSALDRATEKLLDTYLQYCHVKPESAVSEEDRATFYSLAPGLEDFINLFSDEDRSERHSSVTRIPLQSLSERDSGTHANKRTSDKRVSRHSDIHTKKSKRQEKSERGGDSGEEEDDIEEEEIMPAKNSAPSRAMRAVRRAGSDIPSSELM
jgi:hypothetical protein